MSPEKLSVLEHLKTNGAQPAVEIAKHLYDEDRQFYMKCYELLADLQTDNYVRFKNDNSFPLCSVVLAPPGEDALAKFQQRNKDKAEKKREKKFDRILQIFLVAFGFALGMIAEHFGSFVSVLFGLFS